VAERRMFAKTIIDSDAFLELPQKAQLLYFHLGIRADDDGFVNKPKSVMRMVGCSEEDLKRLVEGKFLISFDSGVVVIRHWRVHNYIRGDRLRPTVHTEEKAALSLDGGGAYTLCQSSDGQVTDNWQAQDRLGKDRLGQFSFNQESIGGCGDSEADAWFLPPSTPEVMIYVKQKKYDVDPERFVRFYEKNGWMEGGRKMTDWKKAVDLWQQRKW